MWRFRTALVVTVAAGLVGCESSSPGGAGSRTPPTLSSEVASAAGLGPQEVADANALYTIKCAKCHQFYDPNDYALKDWEKWMRKMSRKAKLQTAQQELLTRYLAAFREQSASARPNPR